MTDINYSRDSLPFNPTDRILETQVTNFHQLISNPTFLARNPSTINLMNTLVNFRYLPFNLTRGPSPCVQH